jgi:glutathione synthase/RimK-type ligase-like ATP-grasp enzyme
VVEAREEPEGRDPDFKPLVEALAALGVVDVAHPCWDDPDVDWSSYSLAVIRSTWDYVTRLDEFLAWVARAAAVCEVCNPPVVVAVNTDKHYLGGLAAHGVPVIPTWFVAPGSDLELPRLVGDVVVKPAVGAGARGVGRFSTIEAASGHVASLLDAGDTALVQPYLSAVETGEIGLVYFDGVFSHAFGKQVVVPADAAPSSEVSGPMTIAGRVPTAAERAVADRAVAACAADLLYARVDLIADGDGAPRVAELEVTEPAFFFELSGASAAPLAQAIARRIGVLDGGGV